MTQNELVKIILKQRPLTQRQALKYGIDRLPARVYDIKQEGAPVSTRMIKKIRRNGKVCRIAEYSWMA